MKIALVNKKFSLSGGGAERYAVDLANALIAQGHEVDCYGNVLENLDPAINTYTVSMFRKPGWLRILSFESNFKKIINNKKSQYDIVYALTQVFPVDLYFMGGGAHKHWLSIRFPNPVLNCIKKIISPNHLAQLWLEDQIFKKENCTAILANSFLVKEHAKLYGGVSDERAFVVHNGIDNKRFNLTIADDYRDSTREEFKIAENDFVISYLAHNWRRKGLITIFQAMAILKSRHGINCKILVAGKGNIEEFKREGLDMGLTEESIVFVGSFAYPERLYVASEVSILPTMYDPCAGVTVEAMACGVPVITTPDNGSHELIKHGESGFVLSAYDASEELAEYLLLLQNKEVRGRFGEVAEKAVSYRSFEQVVNETIAIMKNVVLMKK